MSRLIFTFENVFQVMAADKALRGKVDCRPTPTPAGLSSSICGMSIEIMREGDKQGAIECLAQASINPTGVHHVD